ncbi:MAG: PBP1A family penicillin-binding protein [Nitrospirae bacterium]|nr:PBP1A family penicillin-binding protein [Nitrospirota bacterium]
MRSLAGSRKPRRRRRVRRIWWGAAALALVAGYLGSLYVTVTSRFEGPHWKVPSTVYAEPVTIYPGMDVSAHHIHDRLLRLGYGPVTAAPRRPGEFRWNDDRLELYLQDFVYPDHAVEGFPVAADLRDRRVVRLIRLPDNAPLTSVDLEPEVIAGLFDESWEGRRLVRLGDVPPVLTDAILAVEDARFYEHWGIDPRSIARAIWTDLKEGEFTQGGSTLTQQLVKNFYLTQERTLYRKITEAIMAVILEARYDKRAILEAYLNEIYLGQRGEMGVYGVGEASRLYFGKDVERLTLPEAALLAGMIRSPRAYNPQINPDRARTARDRVIHRMLALKKIDADEAREALAEPVPTRPKARAAVRAPYFVDVVREQLERLYSRDVLTSEGLRVFTSLDVEAQRNTEEALRAGIAAIERRIPKGDDPLEGGVIVIQPQTGYIRALIGGRDYAETQFNRMTQAHRQPGSLFKPLAYLAALRRDGETGSPRYTPVSVVQDAPLTVVTNGRSWTPQNYDKLYHGPVTLRTALEYSFNAAAVGVAQDIGVERVIATARALGITTPLQAVPSLVLGTSEVIPLELAGAYAAVANFGTKTEPLVIKAVMDQDGRVLSRKEIAVEQVVSPEEAYLITSLLQGVVERGTGRGVRALGFDRPVAGKTGTTSDFRDAWFVGYTPDTLALVWVGFDHNRPLQLTGAQAALPIWTDVMRRVTEGEPPTDFTPPPGIVLRQVDPASGLLSNRQCPDAITEAFLAGTEPTGWCGDHGGPRFLWWLRRVLG